MSLDESKRWKKEKPSASDLAADPNKLQNLLKEVKAEEKKQQAVSDSKHQLDNLKAQHEQEGGKGTVGTMEGAQKNVMNVKEKPDAKKQVERAKQQQKRDEEMQKMEQAPTGSA